MLVELPAAGDDVELDGKTPYEYVHFLTQEGKTTQNSKDAYFALLGGVNAGNSLLSIYRDGRLHSESCFVEEGTIHYEPAHYKEPLVRELSVKEKSSLG